MLAQNFIDQHIPETTDVDILFAAQPIVTFNFPKPLYIKIYRNGFHPREIRVDNRLVIGDYRRIVMLISCDNNDEHVTRMRFTIEPLTINTVLNMVEKKNITISFAQLKPVDRGMTIFEEQIDRLNYLSDIESLKVKITDEDHIMERLTYILEHWKKIKHYIIEDIEGWQCEKVIESLLKNNEICSIHFVMKNKEEEKYWNNISSKLCRINTHASNLVSMCAKKIVVKNKSDLSVAERIALEFSEDRLKQNLKENLFYCSIVR